VRLAKTIQPMTPNRASPIQLEMSQPRRNPHQRRTTAVDRIGKTRTIGRNTKTDLSHDPDRSRSRQTPTLYNQPVLGHELTKPHRRASPALLEDRFPRLAGTPRATGLGMSGAEPTARADRIISSG
jgi:hypothetical protein